MHNFLFNCDIFDVGAHAGSLSRISIVDMTGAAIAIDDASAADTVLSVKQRVFAANRKLFVRRQRLVYQPGPYGMDALADDETLGGAGVAEDGTAVIDVLIEPLTEAELKKLHKKARYFQDIALLGMCVCLGMVQSVLSFSIVSANNSAMPATAMYFMIIFFHAMIQMFKNSNASFARPCVAEAKNQCSRC